MPRDLLTGSPKDLPHEGHLPPHHPHVADNDSEAEISLNAQSGTCTGETMRLIISMQDHTHLPGRLRLHPLLHGGSGCTMPKPDSTQGWHDHGGGQRQEAVLPWGLLDVVVFHQRRVVLHRFPHHRLGGL
jgi:hypothetical protein